MSESGRGVRAIPGGNLSSNALDMVGFGRNPTPMWVYDVATLRILAVNDAAVRHYGYSRKTFLTLTIRDLRPPDHVPMLENDLAQPIYGLSHTRGWVHRKKNGEVIDVEITSESVAFEDRAARLVLATDVTQQQRAKAELAFSAHHDSLTGLPNRAKLAIELADAIASAQRNATLVAVLFIDLDRFKLVNDTFGHIAGDGVLATIARRLSAGLRARDIVARPGGDEFIVILRDIARRDDIVVLIDRLVAAFQAPVTIAERNHFVSASIGVSVFPDHAGSAELLLQAADTAMYRAKTEGLGVYWYSSELTAQSVQRLSLEADLHRAVDESEFTVWYQPILDVRDDAIVTVEALARWCDPARGLRMPLEFLAGAEETGLIVPLGRTVLTRACRDLVAWRREGAAVGIAVNVSARQLGSDIVRDVTHALTGTGCDPRWLELEVSETALVGITPPTIAALWELHRLGVRMTIDDFGASYSSIANLKRLPVQTVKVDASLIAGIVGDATTVAIVQAIVTMAHALDLAVVAEGIETAGQRALVGELGFDRWQGFHHGEARDKADVERAWLPQAF